MCPKVCRPSRRWQAAEKLLVEALDGRVATPGSHTAPTLTPHATCPTDSAD
ncbi:hypothetical protein OAO87_02095 [bacterium]|nr:hypothetical protein [bacterium]